MKVRYIRWANTSNMNEINCFYLEDRNWNDFGFYTTFNLYYYDREGGIIDIGIVKILNIDTSDTSRVLKKDSYLELDETFVSLGQSEEYYRNIGMLKNIDRIKLLEKLKDISFYSEEKRNNFKMLRGFQTSLLRDWQIANLLENIDNLVNFENIKEVKIQKNQLINNYIYKVKIPKSENLEYIDFNFENNNFLPTKNFVLVGKNGVGKTTILQNLVKDIIEKNNENFIENIPNYQKILMFYYGKDLEFDNSETEELKKFNIKEEIEDLEEKLKIIKEKKRFEYLRAALINLLGIETIDFENLIPIEKLSSGHSVIYKLLLNLLLYIEKGTLVIIDELEVHLHPNIASRLMRILRNTIKHHDGHSIMTTHSPIILQQIPSVSVRKIGRNYNHLFIEKLNFECFGANLTEISQEVFEVSNEDEDYKSILSEIVNQMTKDRLDVEVEVNKLFSNKLRANAELYLQTLLD